MKHCITIREHSAYRVISSLLAIDINMKFSINLIDLIMGQSVTGTDIYDSLYDIYDVAYMTHVTRPDLLTHPIISSDGNENHHIIRLDYCNAIFVGCSSTVLDRLQSVLNAASRLLPQL